MENHAKYTKGLLGNLPADEISRNPVQRNSLSPMSYELAVGKSVLANHPHPNQPRAQNDPLFAKRSTQRRHKMQCHCVCGIPG
eukprot:CAMPEP_0169292550 /NCGR_PEP_ID=MMETSP1016-20121227/62815_1 /TAXON_ID=342587 /ORGANISM="Karlodinium micrum, Strain CCMP2283" /LENGTH=82 /DNA_ID=CAMNT_0009383179 /DNA_START=348 /DNA_END=596 /DNA_ORIENTATION=-